MKLEIMGRRFPIDLGDKFKNKSHQNSESYFIHGNIGTYVRNRKVEMV